MNTQVTDKGRAIQAAIGSIEKQFGRGSIMALDTDRSDNVKVIRTGSRALDEALGVGGYPRGRIVEVYGPESAGKTTLGLHALSEAQRAGGVAAFIDAEHALDIAYAKRIGIDQSRLLVSQPDHGEQALEITESLARSGAVDVIVIDSVPALTPKAEIEGDMGSDHTGAQARLMSQALRKLTAVLFRTETLVLFTNQLRTRTGVLFGNTETTTGGNALKFYASVRLDVRRLGLVKNGEESVGARTRIKVVKNKCAVPFKEAELTIRFGTGIDAAAETLDLAIARDIVLRRGTAFTFQGSTFATTPEAARAAMETSPFGDTIRLALDAHAKPLVAPLP